MVKIIIVGVAGVLYVIISVFNYWLDINTKQNASWIQSFAWPWHLILLGGWTLVSLSTYRWRKQNNGRRRDP